MKKRAFLLIITALLLYAAGGCRDGAPEIDQTAGSKAGFTADSVSFNMVFVPAAAFKTGTDDSGTASVENPFLLGETPVTYELWKKVYDWATEGTRGEGAGEYVISNPGRQGGASGSGPVGTDQHPVTEINWRDAVVWCNALTEWFNAHTTAEYTPVYYTDQEYTSLLREVDDAVEITHDLPGSQDKPYVNPLADGFRLPLSDEWELAARYIEDRNNDGTIKAEGEYYPGNFASGAADAYTNSEATAEVAVFSAPTSVEVGTKKPNALGIYDMNGNVWEWCYEWNPVYGFERRIKRGGSWLDFETPQQLGFVGYYRPFNGFYYIGIRVAKNP